MRQEAVRKEQSFIPIAIVGVGALFAGAKNVAEYWRNIIEKRDLIKDIPESHWLIADYYEPCPKTAYKNDKIHAKRGSFLEDIEFDPIEFGTPPSIVPAIDTAQLLALIVAKQVLNDVSNNEIQTLNLSRTSVILGVSVLEAVQYLSARTQRPIWTKALRDMGLSESTIENACDRIAALYPQWQEDSFPGLLSNVVSGRIANRFNLGGTNCTTDAACASSLAAVLSAINELQTGTADMVITGGVDSLNDILMYKCFSIVGALSASNRCQPFSDEADGTLLGEGIGLFALKRLSEAEANQDKIYAVIKGLGTSSDGRSKSIYAPVSEGQTTAILRAYERAGFEINTVGLIEAHGTGTIAGDVAEYNGLLGAFRAGKNTSHPPSCALGSVKSQIGHTKSAAGAAGLLKAVLALRHKILPATLHVKQPNKKFDLEDSSLYINTETRPWIRSSSYPRRAGVSCFGFGGSNFHVVLEEYTNSKLLPQKIRATAAELIVVSAESQQAFLDALTKIMDPGYLSHGLSYIAYETQKNYQSHFSRSHQHVCVVIVESILDLESKLRKIIDMYPQHVVDKNIYYKLEDNCNLENVKTAFCFPGQGSQYINMAKDLLMHFDDAMSVWEENAPERLKNIVYPPPVFNTKDLKKCESMLKETQYTQPALALVSLSQLALLEKLKLTSDAAIGHSFGELLALYDAGAIDKKTLMDIACERGRLMQVAQSEYPGAMLVVKTSPEKLLALMKNIKSTCVVANFNSLTQQVLSGDGAAIDEIEKNLKLQNITCIRIPVSGAFHSPLMESARKSFVDYLKKCHFKSPNKPVYANLTAKPYSKDIHKIYENLSEQMTNSVKFSQSIHQMYEDGVRIFIEVGPNQVLSQLIKNCLPEQKDIHVIALECDKNDGVTHFWRAIAQLICLGKNLDLISLWEEYNPVTSEMPIKKAHRTLMINGSNYQKPYPQSNISVTTHLTSKLSSMHVIETQERVTMSTQSTRKDMPSYQPSIQPQQASHPSTEISMSLQQDLQRQLIEVHNNHQNALLQSHIAFLNTFSQLAGSLPTASAVPQPISAPVVSRPMNPIPASPQPLPATFTTMTAPQPMPAAPQHHTPVYSQPLQPSLTEISTPIHVEALASRNAQDIIMQIIVDKTGYPLEMLNPEMDIEADLGIDSIKRVEILSTLREKMPHLPEIPAAELSALKTLQDIINFIETNQSQGILQKKKSLSAVS